MSWFWAVSLLLAALGWSLHKSISHATSFISTHKTNLTNWLKSGEWQGKKLLLVIAHPDDECMFFGPALRAFITAGWSVHCVCITAGIDVRRSELEASCKLMGIESAKIIDDSSKFPDSMTVDWDTNALASHLTKSLKLTDYDALLTFDPAGISGHGNHRDVCMAVRTALGRLPVSARVPHLLELESHPLVVKYSGLLSFVYEMVRMSVFEDGSVLVATLSMGQAWRYVVEAMQCHESQLVWFRWLYLLFSRYALVNTLRVKVATRNI